MNILVTGTSSGLGAALVQTLLLNKTYQILGVARQSSVLSPSKRYQCLKADLSSKSAISALDEALAWADVLVNNAAVGHDGLLATQGEGHIEELIAVNLTMPILLSRQFVRHRLRKKMPGQILNVTSIAAHKGYSGLAAYAATKAGLIGFTKALAQEVGPKQIRVNAIAPGFLATKMTSGLSKTQTEKIQHRAPLKRLPSLDNVVKLMVDTIENPDIHGACLVIDAGQSC